MSRFAGAHTVAQQLYLVGILPPAQVGERVEERRGVRVAGAVVETEAVLHRVDAAEQGKLTRPMRRRLAVVPRHLDPFLDMGAGDGLGQSIVVQQLGVTVLPQEKDAAESGAEAKRIDMKVRQIGEVDRIGEAEMIAVGCGVEAFPESQPSLAATFRGERHGVGLLEELLPVIDLSFRAQSAKR